MKTLNSFLYKNYLFNNSDNNNCKLCNKKRREIFFKAKKGEKIYEKLIHYDIISNEIDNRNNKLFEVIKKKFVSKKFQPKQFTINHISK